jgi:hypothetical protein
LSELTAEVDAPIADGFSSHLDATFEKQLLDISVTQSISVVEPDGVSDDGERESIAGQLLIDGHWSTLLKQLARTLH